MYVAVGLLGYLITAWIFQYTDYPRLGLLVAAGVGVFFQLLLWRIQWGNWTPWKD